IVGIGRIVELGDFEAGRAVGRQLGAVIGEIGNGSEADGAVGAADAEAAVAVVHVVGGAFQNFGGEAARLVDDLVAGAPDGGAGDRSGTRAPGAVAERNAIGVALDHGDVVDGEAEPVGGDLCKGDVVALAVRVRAGQHGDLAVAVHAHDGALPAAV